MSKILNRFNLTIMSGLLILAVSGCSDNNETVFVAEDLPPQAPQSVTSITGDSRITIVWNGLTEDDIVEYVVGWNDSLLGEFNEIGRVPALPRPVDNRYGFVDTDVTNGTTYFYAVWAIDESNQVSPPSAEAVFDTPHPEGNVDLFTLFINPSLSGFALASGTRVPRTDPNVDVFVDEAWLVDTFLDTSGIKTESTLIFFLKTADKSTDIQDLGYTDSFDEIDWAPNLGWSDLRSYEIIAGHTYVIWTWDEHYAKLRVNSIDWAAGFVNLDWAYQLADTSNTYGNRELSGRPPENNLPGVVSLNEIVIND